MSHDSGLTFAPIPAGALVDSHCHLDFPDFDGRMDDLRQSMAAHGISHALCICVNLDGFKKVIDIADQYPNFFATVGVHPDQLPDVPGASCSVEDLIELARQGLGQAPTVLPRQQLLAEFLARTSRALMLPLLPLLAVPFGLSAKRAGSGSAMAAGGALLFLFETEQMVFGEFRAQVECPAAPERSCTRVEALVEPENGPWRLTATVRGQRFDENVTRRGAAVKAVTYHNFALRPPDHPGGDWVAEMVFDV